MAVVGILYLGFIVLMVASVWKVFEKAGQPGWACLIPIYSFYVMAKIAGKKNWWLIFIPIANIFIAISVVHGISKSFGKDVGFTIGLLLLGIVCWPILGFGSVQYIGPNGVNEMKEEIDAIGNNG